MTFIPVLNKDKIIFNHKHHLPSSLRLMISGSSGSGKTTMLLTILLDGTLDYNRLILCSPSTNQPEYQLMIKAFRNGLSIGQVKALFQYQNECDDLDELIRQVSYENDNKNKIEVIIYEDTSLIPSPQKLVKEKSKTIIIIDDSMMSSQTEIDKVAVYGRPLNLNLIYLTQSFFKTNKKSCRDQMNVFIFFKLSRIDLVNIYNHLATNDFKTFEEFAAFASDCWKEKYNFLTIRRDEDDINLRYTKNLF